MNTFTRIALGTLTTLATITTPALATYEVDGYHFMDGSEFGENSSLANEMINSLDDHGVSVLDGVANNIKVCDPEEDGSRVLGFYSPKYNFMVVCSSSDIPTWLMFETLVHETVHVIQDLRDGIDNESLVGPQGEYMSFLGKNLNPAKAENIQNMYQPEDWAIESEAFYFETQPQVVLNELQSFEF